ncbi:hypothetical protein BH20ACT9_BH20ACT9_04980 [soil metagenome]
MFSAALVAGGVSTGLALWLLHGLVSPVPADARGGAAVALAVAAALRDCGAVRCRLPQRRSLVPREVLDDRRYRGTAMFGYELGTGVRTRLPTTAPYGLAAAVLLLATDPSIAVAAGAGFGAGRALTIWARLAAHGPGAWDAACRRHGRALGVVASVALVVGLLGV